MHVTHQGQGHQARDACAPLPTLTRLPLQSKCAPAPRHPRHRPAQIQDSNFDNVHLIATHAVWPFHTTRDHLPCTLSKPQSGFYQRLLLARSRRLPVLRTAKEQQPILATEDRTQQTARHRETHPAPPPRLAHHNNMGMTPLSVSFLAKVTRSGDENATAWDAVKKRANANWCPRTATPPYRPLNRHSTRYSCSNTQWPSWATEKASIMFIFCPKWLYIDSIFIE